LQDVGGFREPAIGNVVRRVMAAVREEAMSEPSTQTTDTDTFGSSESGSTSLLPPPQPRNQQLSLQSMLWAHPQTSTTTASSSTSSHTRHDSPSLESSTTEQLPPPFYAHRPDLKQGVMEAIQEIINDLEDMHKNINEQSLSHIHAGEVILTYGQSKTIELFLKAAAAKKRTFQVVVCEAAPHFGGQEMAQNLAEAGIDTILIHDSATFAVMARINKVVLPAHAVLVRSRLESTLVQLLVRTHGYDVVFRTD